MEKKPIIQSIQELTNLITSLGPNVIAKIRSIEYHEEWVEGEFPTSEDTPDIFFKIDIDTT